MDRKERTTLLTTLTVATESAGGMAAGVSREQLWPDIYDELRRLANFYMTRGQHPQLTLQPTALVNEAFVRLVDHQSLAEQSQTHFFAIAANAMRYVLADYARRRNAEKRGGNLGRVTMHSGVEGCGGAGGSGGVEGKALDALDLHEALARLEEQDVRAYRIVELRFFSGLSIRQTAAVLNISAGTVKNEWRWARVWLLAQLEAEERQSEDENAANGRDGYDS